ncbi:hypothetical protein [Sphingomonas qomolangmaensis]|uniref:Transmembrane protein n=1 Tax=Sphingomonas qomolangmaensis TaxID=2918765 RepID=A0ABY5L6Z0_9SPHN|nr:hypothetical protein [Sphingomonas qomolangmaensis]UUL82734.1 hypothetical protein NMP03_00335 [Sphingomonas qomolangmaensis]
MGFKSLVMASAGLALVAAPVAVTAAPANPASSLSVSKSVRAGTSTSKSNGVAGMSTIPLVILAGMVAGVAYLVIDKENDDDVPDSN